MPRDLIVFEHLAGGSFSDPKTWSDLVHFDSNSYTMYSDGENGFSSIPGGSLSLNATAITEVQTGTGTEADITIYQAGSATYNVHSDAAGNEGSEGGSDVPEPSTFALLAAGGIFVLAMRRWIFCLARVH